MKVINKTSIFVAWTAALAGTGMTAAGVDEVTVPEDVRSPLASLRVGDQLVDLPTPGVNPDGKTWGLESKGVIEVFNDAGGLEARIEGLNVLFNPDPFITYGVAVIDFGAPSVFGFTFGTPIVATGSPGTATASFSGSVTDGGSDGVGFIALPPLGGVPTDGAPDEAQVFNLGLPFPLTNPGLDLGPSIAAIPLAGGSGAMGPYAGSGPLPAGVWSWLQIDLTFSGTGGGDIYTLNGKGEIVSRAMPDAGNSVLGLVLGWGAMVAGQRWFRGRK